MHQTGRQPGTGPRQAERRQSDSARRHGHGRHGRGMDQIDMLGRVPYLREVALRELMGDGLVSPQGVLPADAPEPGSDGPQ
ncbi:hypothetical protein GCM10010297_12530 [Streptomyces malachitofuscus]|nr:hypothetical protein GCM10010297_12530 [Streptomyces malachitofuscus]